MFIQVISNYLQRSVEITAGPVPKTSSGLVNFFLATFTSTSLPISCTLCHSSHSGSFCFDSRYSRLSRNLSYNAFSVGTSRHPNQTCRPCRSQERCRHFELHALDGTSLFSFARRRSCFVRAAASATRRSS
jgi:hypothetical protein